VIISAIIITNSEIVEKIVVGEAGNYPHTHNQKTEVLKMKVTLYKDIRLKDGTVLQKGRKALIFPREQSDRTCHVKMTDTGDLYVLHYTSVIKPPDLSTLMSQDLDGVVESIDGEMVEPDGHSPDGFPSWLLALGML